MDKFLNKEKTLDKRSSAACSSDASKSKCLQKVASKTNEVRSDQACKFRKFCFFLKFGVIKKFFITLLITDR